MDLASPAVSGTSVYANGLINISYQITTSLSRVGPFYTKIHDSACLGTEDKGMGEKSCNQPHIFNRCVEMQNISHCGRLTQICVFNTVKLGTSACSPQCRSTRGNVSRGITPSSTTRVFVEYFLKISVHKNSQRICYKFLKKHSIKVV